MNSVKLAINTSTHTYKKIFILFINLMTLINDTLTKCTKDGRIISGGRKDWFVKAIMLAWTHSHTHTHTQIL